MGAHKNNPVAQLAREGNTASIARIVTEFRYGYGFEVAIEPNKVKMAEITAYLDGELAAGKEPKDIDTHFELKPEDQDYVVYHRIQQFREIKITQQTACCNIRGPEHFRMPLAEVMARAQHAFDGGPSENQA